LVFGKKPRKINRKIVMFESSKFDKSGLKFGGHIRAGPDLKNGRIPAGAGYDIRCNPSSNVYMSLFGKHGLTP